MLMIASGYEDGNDATALRSDLAFKLAQNVLPSSPELSSQGPLELARPALAGTAISCAAGWRL